MFSLFHESHSGEPGTRKVRFNFFICVGVAAMGSQQHINGKDGAIFAVNMLMGTHGGGTYTYEEIEADLSQAGFAAIHLMKKGEHMDALVEAFKL
jgi:hypothetical protein